MRFFYDISWFCSDFGDFGGRKQLIIVIVWSILRIELPNINCHMSEKNGNQKYVTCYLSYLLLHSLCWHKYCQQCWITNGPKELSAREHSRYASTLFKSHSTELLAFTVFIATDVPGIWKKKNWQNFAANAKNHVNKFSHKWHSKNFQTTFLIDESW